MSRGGNKTKKKKKIVFKAVRKRFECGAAAAAPELSVAEKSVRNVSES